jgi:hypothetical protein
LAVTLPVLAEQAEGELLVNVIAIGGGSAIVTVEVLTQPAESVTTAV